MKVPKLKPNESAQSFKARVKAWERATGKKYPRRKIGVKSDEQRVLEGEPRLKGLTKKKDYSANYEDTAKEFATQRLLKTQKKKTEADLADEKKEAQLETLGKTDFSKVKLPPIEKKKDNNEKVKIKKAEPIGKADKTNKKPAEPIGKTNEKSKVKDLTIEKKPKKKKKYTARDRMREKNEERFGKEAVNRLKIRHSEWKKARREGKLKEWEKKYKRK
tara:strand:- start:3113 stop:3766 length:654 start_codon:yes stop_codon:yes gene_type:complete